MSTLTCFASNYYYNRYAVMTNDVVDVIPLIRTELLTRNNPAWTEPSTALFKSPPDAAGRWMDVLITRIDSQTLEMRVRDWTSRTICTRRVQMGGLPAYYVFIYSGQFYFHLDCLTNGGWAPVFAGILDLSPDAQSAHQYCVIGGGYLSATNVNDSLCTLNKFFMYDNYGGVGSSPNRNPMFSASSNSNGCLYNLNGARIYKPSRVVTQWSSVEWRIAGRRYQSLVGIGDMPFLTRVTVPIDNVSGVFQMTSLTGHMNHRLAIRVA